MSGLFSLLQDIVDKFVCWIETGIVLFANLVLSALAAILTGLLAILPSMPSLPGTPTWVADAYHFVAYWFPVDWALTLGASLLTLWLAWLGIAVVLRWGKVLGGRA